MRAYLSSYLILAGLAISAPSTSHAGEILRQTPTASFEWKTTECRKPIQNMSRSLSTQERLQAYSNDITQYLACLQREAQRDFEHAQSEMQRAIETELAAETKRMDEMIKRAYKTAR